MSENYLSSKRLHKKSERQTDRPKDRQTDREERQTHRQTHRQRHREKEPSLFLVPVFFSNRNVLTGLAQSTQALSVWYQSSSHATGNKSCWTGNLTTVTPVTPLSALNTRCQHTARMQEAGKRQTTILLFLGLTSLLVGHTDTGL